MAPKQRPLGAYAVLAGGFTGGLATFIAAMRRQDGLPERIPPADVVMIGVATHKLSRLITKDRISAFVRAPFAEPRGESPMPGEVEDRARGDGLQAAVGQLLTCPHCLSMWLAAGFAGGLVTLPRETRLVAAMLSSVAVSDFLQVSYRKTAQQSEEGGAPAQAPREFAGTAVG